MLCIYMWLLSQWNKMTFYYLTNLRCASEVLGNNPYFNATDFSLRSLIAVWARNLVQNLPSKIVGMEIDREI
jgi:hypothetical protein